MAKQNRQTVSYLTQRFEQVGLEPDARHGQNFLIDLNLLKMLATTGDVGPQDVVLEVGTGTGSLTGLLAQRAGAVVTVEIDWHLYQLASEELEEFDNVVMLKQDALRNKNNFDDKVLNTIKEEMAKIPGCRLKLVANLPYNVATPILSNLLRTEIVPHSMVATIQKELGERIVAKPSTKDYSALSIWMQSICDCEIVRIMAPSVFWPRPKVHSAIIKCVFRPEKRDRIVDLKFYHEFVRSLFFHRRKFIRSVVISSFKGQLTKPQVDEVLTDMEFGPDVRAEQLPPETILELSEKFRQKLESIKE